MKKAFKKSLVLVLSVVIVLSTLSLMTFTVSADDFDPTWPVDASISIHLRYGYTYSSSPNKLHTGIDLSKSGGGCIYAAESGQITIKDYGCGGSHRSNASADIKCPLGVNCTAAKESYDGQGSYGNYATIKHNSTFTTLYGHMSSFCVENGSYVQKGQKIGMMGTTGNSSGTHLHFEIIKNGTKINPEVYLTSDKKTNAYHFDNPLPPGDPTINLNKSKITTAENIAITFGNISNSSLQYLQILNLSNNQLYYDGYCTGESVHYQSFSQVGNYLISYQTSNASGASNVVTARFLVYDGVPSAPILSVSADAIATGKSITINHWSETAHYYSMSIYYNETSVYYTTDATGSTTISFNEPGRYKVVCSAVNDYGESDYSEIFFDVYNGIPNKPDLWLSNYSVSQAELFTIYHWSGNAKWYSMSIYKDGQSVLYTTDYASYYETLLAEAGDYKIVCSAVNEYGESDYSELLFTINSSLPCMPETWVDKYYNIANKDFQLHRWSEKASYYSTSIYKNDILISNIQDSYGIITLNLSEPGEYKAVSQASNDFGASNYSECYFYIYNNIPSKPSVLSDKMIYNIGETVLIDLDPSPTSNSAFFSIRHKDSGNTIVGPGEQLPVTQSSYSFTPTETGEYNVEYQTVNEFGSSECAETTVRVIQISTIDDPPVHEHIFAAVVIENEVASTCSVAGSYDEVIYCSDCHEEISREKKTIPIDIEAHNWGEWAVTKTATCIQKGTEVRICANDNTHTQTRDIAALGHKPTDWIIDREAQIGVAGSKHKECTVCHAVLQTEEIPALAGPVIPDENSPQIVIESKKARPGSTVEIKIALKNNPGIASLKLKVAFPSDLTLTSVVYNNAIGGQSQPPQTFGSPVVLNWYNGGADSNGDFVYATLTFKVSDTAQAGNNVITATYNPNDVYNINETNIDFAVVNGGIEISPYVPGDINGDGDVNNKDLTRLFQYLSEWQVSVNEAALDVNGDGAVNNKDLTRLFQYLSEWDVEIF